jgi:hypothetical protein
MRRTTLRPWELLLAFLLAVRRPQLVHVSRKNRKLRLFAVACARRLNHLSRGVLWQRIGAAEFGYRLTVAERVADGGGSVEELHTSWDAGLNCRVIGAAPAPWRSEHFAEAAAGDACDRDASDAALWAMLFGQYAADPWAKTDQFGELPEGTEHHPQVSLLRDVFGNPFLPIALNPAWQTPTVLALAQAAYDHRTLPSGHLEPDRLAVLADALEEAGCTDANILTHLRQPGEHVRGCWAVDLVLGKQ